MDLQWTFTHVSHNKEVRNAEGKPNGFDLNIFWCLTFSFIFCKKYISKVFITTILNHFSVLVSKNVIHPVEKIRAPQKSLRGCEAAALRCYCMCFFFTCLEAVGTNSLNNQSRTYELRAVVRFSNLGRRRLFITILNSNIPPGWKALLLYFKWHQFQFDKNEKICQMVLKYKWIDVKLISSNNF